MTIEDESAVANVIVWPKVFERVRPVVLGARYVAVSGRVQEESGVIHVVADRLEDLTHGWRGWPTTAARSTALLAPTRCAGRSRISARRAPSAAATTRCAADARDAGACRRPRRPARGSAHTPTQNLPKRGPNYCGTTLAASDIDAVGYNEPFGFFIARQMAICAPGLSSLLSPADVGADHGVGRHHDLLLAALVFDHQHRPVDAGHRLLDGAIGHGAVRLRVPRDDGPRPARAAISAKTVIWIARWLPSGCGIAPVPI